MTKKKTRLGPYGMPYEMLNKHEKESLRAKDSIWHNKRSASRNYRCKQCGTNQSEDLCELRIDFCQCQRCGHEFVIDNRKSKQKTRRQYDDDTSSY